MFGLLSHDNLAQASLWHPPDLCGVVEKQGRRSGEWNARYFILKGSNLFWFSRPSSRKPRGHVPLEGATVHAVRPPAISVYTQHMHEDERNAMPALFGMVVVLDDVFAASPGGRPELVLAVGSAELQALWTKALQQAAIPRPQLLAQLQESSKLVDMLGELQAKQGPDPFTDHDTIPAVMDTRGRAASSSPHGSRQNVRFSSPQPHSSRSMSASPQRPASDSGAAGDPQDVDEYGNSYEPSIGQTRNSVLTSTGSHAVPLPVYINEDEQDEVARQLGPPFMPHGGANSYAGTHNSPCSIYAGSRSAMRGLERAKSPLRVRAERILKGLKDVLTGAGRAQHHHHYYLANGAQIPSPQMAESLAAADPYAVLEQQVAEQQMMESVGGAGVDGHWGSPSSPHTVAHGPGSFYSDAGGRLARSRPPAANTGSVGGALVHNIISDWAVDGEVEQQPDMALHGPSRSMQSPSNSSSTWRPALASNGNSSPHGYVPRAALLSSTGRSVASGSARSRTRSTPHGSATDGVRTTANASGGSNASVDLPAGVDGAWLLSAFQQMQASLNQVASTLQAISSVPTSPSGIAPSAQAQQSNNNAVAVDSLSAVRQQLQACLAALQGQEQMPAELPFAAKTGSRGSHSASGMIDMTPNVGASRDTVSFSGFATPSSNSPMASMVLHEQSPAFPRASSPSVISGVRVGSQSVMQAVQQALPRASDVALVVGPRGSMSPVDIQHTGLLSDSQQLHMSHMENQDQYTQQHTAMDGGVPLPTFSDEPLMTPRDEGTRVRDAVALSMHELQARLTALNSSLAEREARASAESNDLDGVLGAGPHSDRSGSMGSPHAYGVHDALDGGYISSSAIQNAVVGLPSRLSVMSARDGADRKSGMYMGQQAGMPFTSDVQEALESSVPYADFLPEADAIPQPAFVAETQMAARPSMTRAMTGARSSYGDNVQLGKRASCMYMQPGEEVLADSVAYDQQDYQQPAPMGYEQPRASATSMQSYEHNGAAYTTQMAHAQQHRATAPPRQLQRAQRSSSSVELPSRQLPRASAPPTILQQYAARASMSPPQPPRSASMSTQQQARLSALGLVGDAGTLDQLVIGQGPLSDIGRRHQRSSSAQLNSHSQEVTNYPMTQDAAMHEDGMYWDGVQQGALHAPSVQRSSHMTQSPRASQLHAEENEQQPRTSSQLRMSQQWQDDVAADALGRASAVSAGFRASDMSNMQPAATGYSGSRSASPSRVRHSMLAQQAPLPQYNSARSASPSQVRGSMLTQMPQPRYSQVPASQSNSIPAQEQLPMRMSQASGMQLPSSECASVVQRSTGYSMASQWSGQPDTVYSQPERPSQFGQRESWSQQPSARTSQVLPAQSGVWSQQSQRTSQHSQQRSWSQQSESDMDARWQESVRSSNLQQPVHPFDEGAHSSMQELQAEPVRPSFSRAGSQSREPSFAAQPLETIQLADSSNDWAYDARQPTRVTRTGSHSVAMSGYSQPTASMSSSHDTVPQEWHAGMGNAVPELNPARQGALSSARSMTQAAGSSISSSPSAGVARQWGSDANGIAVVDTVAAAFSARPNVRIPSALVPVSELQRAGEEGNRASFQTRQSNSNSIAGSGQAMSMLPAIGLNIRPSTSSSASPSPGHKVGGMELNELECLQEQPALARRARYSSTDWC